MAAPNSTANKIAPSIPKINLLLMHKEFSKAFTSAMQSHKLSESISHNIVIHNTHLGDLPTQLTFDVIVSPANSYGILDGGFDDAISRYFSPRGDYGALTRAVQAKLYEDHRGFLAPGNCELVEIPEDLVKRSKSGENGWGCDHIAICPTMRTPDDCTWDREVVYECVWNLLCAISRHNRHVGSSGKTIGSILMTPLGTGTGGIGADKWAHQVVIALKHFEESEKDAEKWMKLNWPEARVLAHQVWKTHSL